VQVTGRVVTQDLLDLEYIENHYRVTVPDFVCSLAFAKHVSKELRVESWFGSSIALALPTLL